MRTVRLRGLLTGRARRRGALALAGALAVTLLAGSAAWAEDPLPPASMADGGLAVDANLGYKPQKTCSPTAKPGTKALLDLLIQTWGGSSWGISRSCASGGTSEHKEGRALDWHMDVNNASEKARVEQALEWMTANNGEVAYRLGIMYIMWDQRIWSIYYQEMGWRTFSDRGSYTANHKDHVHISLTWDGAMEQTSWWTGVPVTTPLLGPCGTTGQPACLPVINRAASPTWPFAHAQVGAFTPAAGDVPMIQGSPMVGQVLGVVPSRSMAGAVGYSYQWYAGGKPISGATASSLRVTTALRGKAIKVALRAALADGSTIAQNSPGTTAVTTGKVTLAPTPAISGVPALGHKLTTKASGWQPTGLKFAYQWYRNGKAIKGATKRGYTLRTADVGRWITVKVTGSASGVTARSALSAKIKALKTVPTPVTPDEPGPTLPVPPSPPSHDQTPPTASPTGPTATGTASGQPTPDPMGAASSPPSPAAADVVSADAPAPDAQPAVSPNAGATP
ncbi:MAG: hypothetical protein LBR32_09365 [Propionibacteriaceae bacterium]|jgi:hypothetical protein|nr:hypothetical protein [Propionibacteriaceae bacterium]